MPRVNAINYNRLAKYNFDYISIEEVLVLEYLLSYFQKGALEMVTLNKIEVETGIKYGKLSSTVENLKEKGFINSSIEHAKTKFSINFDHLVHKLNKLYKKSNVYASQYFLFVQNPQAFKTNAVKAKRSKIVQKIRGKEAKPHSQMSLF